MSPEEQELVALLASACYDDLAAATITGIGYGASFLGTLIAIRLLNAFSLVQVHLGLVEEATQPPQSVTIAADVNSFVSIVVLYDRFIPRLFHWQILIGDAVVCWRAWVLLHRNRFWKFTLALLMLSNIVVNIVDASFDVAVVNTDLIDGATVIFDCLALATTLAVNLLATSLIGWKVWSHHQTLKAASMATKTPIQKILLLLVESGIFFLAVQLLAFIAELGGTLSTSNPNPNFRTFMAVSTSLFLTVSCLYPVAVIILIKMNKSPVAETFYSQQQRATSVTVEVDGT
ncbi:hypothetical protein BDP27DRAFT_1370672 [Rhodocollybia butyracea]|uniref:Uncharacterized protein n=1 Tax=Rhodocollybia butyracea TaxID=206335 RepID=A0A9P5TZF2_9AGAR|nr:hypothetical protein BDP27DRAFT_1370672 [Rhodocollybia butyracea]